MATLLFNHLRHNFDQAAVITLDLNGNSRQMDSHLQEALEQLGSLKPHPLRASRQQLQQQLEKTMRQRRVLLLLENVNHREQCDALLPSPVVGGISSIDNSGGGRSRVIVTSREAELNAFGRSKVHMSHHDRTHRQHQQQGLVDCGALIPDP